MDRRTMDQKAPRREPVKPGDDIPNIQISLRDGDVNLQDHFIDKKGLFIGVHGAYEPKSVRLMQDLQPHLEWLVNKLPLIGIVSVNDPYVLKAWGKRLKLSDRLTIVSDVNAAFSSRMGMAHPMMDQGFGKGLRARLSLIMVEEGSKITYVGTQSQPEGMVDGLLEYLTSIGLTTKAGQSKDASKKLSMAPSHASWKPVPIVALQGGGAFTYVPKLPAVILNENGNKPLADLGSFDCEDTITLVNDGSCLRITGGFTGTIEYDGSVFELDEIIYLLIKQNAAINCAAEGQLKFKLKKGEKGAYESVVFSFPLVEDGHDIILSSLPWNFQEGYPMKPGTSMTANISNNSNFTFLKEHGCGYHLYDDMKLYHHAFDKTIFFVSDKAHGISHRQGNELRMMCTPENLTMVENHVTTQVWQAELECI